MRIVILTYESFYANLMTDRLIRARPGQVVGIVRSDCLIYRKSLPGALAFLLRRSGLRFVGRKALELAQSRAIALLRRLVGRPPKVPSLRDIRARYGIPVAGSEDVNDAATLALIRSWQPDLVISIYLNQLIKRDLIRLPGLGCLNLHPALLPRNRGLFPYFWAMANGDTHSGVTLHWVDEKFDTGDFLLQEVVPIEPNDTMTSLQYKSAQVGAEMLVRGVGLIEAGNPPHVPQDNSQAIYYSWPSPADLRRFRQRGGRYGTVFDLMRYM
jgi:folate-dependent phosphoribosylglycinamide formyltransferase PurN